MRLPKAEREDVATIASFASDGHWLLARQCRTPEVIRAVLDQLEGRDAPTLFMRASVRGPDVTEQWLESIDALRALTNPDIARSDKWGSPRRLARLRAIASNPRLVEGVRAAVVAATGPLEIDWFAVLAFDASEDSVDALLPHVARALDADAETIDLLLAVVAKAPKREALRRMTDALAAARTSVVTTSQVPELAALLGVSPEKLRFRLELSAWPKTRVRASLSVDGGAAQTVLGALEVSEPGQAKVTDLAGRDLGAALKFLRDEGAATNLEWSLCELRTHLRGPRAQKLARWLGDALGAQVAVP